MLNGTIKKSIVVIVLYSPVSRPVAKVACFVTSCHWFRWIGFVFGVVALI